MTATIVPFSHAWRERMSQQRTGTSLCGWCLGPPGARRPHKWGIPVCNCPCGCHRRPRRVEGNSSAVDRRNDPQARKVETKDILDTFKEGGGDAEQ